MLPGKLVTGCCVLVGPGLTSWQLLAVVVGTILLSHDFIDFIWPIRMRCLLAVLTIDLLQIAFTSRHISWHLLRLARGIVDGICTEYDIVLASCQDTLCIVGITLSSLAAGFVLATTPVSLPIRAEIHRGCDYRCDVMSYSDSQAFDHLHLSFLSSRSLHACCSVDVYVRLASIH